MSSDLLQLMFFDQSIEERECSDPSLLHYSCPQHAFGLVSRISFDDD
jgi:hypothetical protein